MFKACKIFSLRALSAALALLLVGAAPTSQPATRPSPQEIRDKQAAEKADREAKRISFAIAHGRVVYGMTLEEAREAARKGEQFQPASIDKVHPGDIYSCGGTRVSCESQGRSKPENKDLYNIIGPYGAWIVKVKESDHTIIVIEQIGWNMGYVESRLTR